MRIKDRQKPTLSPLPYLSHKPSSLTRCGVWKTKCVVHAKRTHHSRLEGQSGKLKSVWRCQLAGTRTVVTRSFRLLLILGHTGQRLLQRIEKGANGRGIHQNVVRESLQCRAPSLTTPLPCSNTGAECPSSTIDDERQEGCDQMKDDDVFFLRTWCWTSQKKNGRRTRIVAKICDV